MPELSRCWLVAALVAGCWHDHLPPPPPPSCIDVADHLQEVLAAPVGTVVVRRCTNDRWADNVMRCMLAETATDHRHCKRELTTGQRVALAHDFTALRAPPECEAYERTVMVLAQCAYLPPTIRDDVRRYFVRVMTDRATPEARAKSCRDALGAIDPRTLARCTTP